MWPRISGLWRLLSTAVVLCSVCLLVHSPVRAGPGGSSSAETFCGELLHDGGFETGAFAPWWSTEGAPLIVELPFCSGTYCAHLGPGSNMNSIWQSSTIAFAAAGVKFSGWVLMSTYEPSGPYDWLQLTIDGCGGFTFGWKVWNNGPEDVWQPLRFEYFPEGGLAAGEVWQVLATSYNDASFITDFYLDDLSLTYCCAEDHYEPNDGYDHAYYLEPGATYEVRICPNGNQDWFRFPVLQGQWITAELYDLPVDFDLNLFSSPSRQLCTNQAGTAAESCFVVADQTGEWRARVVGAGGATSNSPALLRVQVADPPILVPTRTPTPMATDQRRICLPLLVK